MLRAQGFQSDLFYAVYNRQRRVLHFIQIFRRDDARSNGACIVADFKTLRIVWSGNARKRCDARAFR